MNKFVLRTLFYLFFLAQASVSFSADSLLWTSVKNPENYLKDISIGPEVLKFEVVDLAKNVLTSNKDKAISVNLPDGRQIKIVMDDENHKDKKDSLVLSGRISGEPFSTVTFSKVKNAIVGDIVSTKGKGGTIYRLKYLNSGVGIIELLNQNKLPTEISPLVPSLRTPVDLPSGVQRLQTIKECNCDQNPSAAAAPNEPIKVLVCYSKAAADAEYGEGGINARIVQAIRETNQSFSYSGAQLEVQLVGDPEKENCDIGTFKEQRTILQDLNALTWVNDGRIDQIQTKRDMLKADIVVLVVERGDAGGIAHQMTSSTMNAQFAKYAFAVVARSVLTGKYGLAHEIGHLMGAQHDNESSSSPGAFEYSYGFVEPNGANTTCMKAPWMTLMSQRNACGDCANIPIWSTAKPVEWKLNDGSLCSIMPGKPGKSENAKTLDETAPIVRGFR